MRTALGAPRSLAQKWLVGIRQAADRYTIALVAIVAVGGVLRMATLSARSFWLDEAYTVLLLKHDFGAMLATIPETETTPPLYYVLAWGWTRLFGLSEAGVRSFSALLGIALIVVAYFAGRELFSRRAGVVAAALIAVNPFLIWYSQEARAYALVALLGGLSFLFFLRARAGKRHALPWWSAVSALALLTHYYALFLVAAEAAWLLLPHGRRRGVMTALLPVAAAAASLLPLAIAGDPPDWIADEPLFGRLRTLVPEYLVGLSVAKLVAVPIALACLVALWLLFRRASPAYRQRALVVAGVGAGAVSLTILIALAGIDFVISRNLIWVILPAMLVVAAGLGLPESGRVGPAVALAVCLLSVALVAEAAEDPKFGEDWRGAAKAMGDDAPEGRAIVLTRTHGHRPLMVYLNARFMPPAGSTVRELVLLGSVDATFETGRGGSAPDPRFDRVEAVKTEYFTLVRFRAARAVLVEREELESRLGAQIESVLVHR